MCLNPVTMHNGQVRRCNICRQCVDAKINDWTGRCIAESKTAAAFHSVTLTYGRDGHYDAVDHVRAAVLTYSDVQEYFDKLRKAGYPARYFVCGEYGSKKGRAHWHCLLFWKDKVPDRELNVNINCEYWPHGFSFWQTGDYKSVRYVTKYISKEVKTGEREYHKSLSMKPPLGDAYFRALARKYVDQGLAPQNLLYSFPEIRDKEDMPWEYMMWSVTAKNFMRAFRDAWWERYGDHPPESPALAKFEDAEKLRGSKEEARALIAAEKVDPFARRETVPKVPYAGSVRKPEGEQLRPWMKPERVIWAESLHHWIYEFEGNQTPWYWSRDTEGVWEWRAKIGETFAQNRIRGQASLGYTGDHAWR